MPHLHNRHGGAAYLEPDYMANHADDQLPLLSTMGRGPQGEGLYVGNIINTEDTVSFALYSTLTNELVWQSPNLAPAEISFQSADWRDLVPGVHADLDITVKRGNDTETHTVYIPAGQPGSIVYLLNETMQRTADDTYTTTISKLTVYGRSQYPSKPTPRPNDIVFFNWRGDDGYGFAFGTIEDVGGTTRETASSDPVTTSTNVVFTARTFVKVPPITIGQNGHWFVDGVDTGMAARGEKGDKGDKGEQGPRGLKGEKGDKGDTGTAGTNATVRVGSTVQLEPGAQAYVTDTDPSDSNAVLEFGIPEGKPATIPEVVYTVLDPDEPGSVTIEQISSNANSYRLNIRLPRGEDGKSLDVQHGIWTPYNLPDFDETPINTAFVVDDGDRFIDLYIRGRIAHDAEDGGPWTVIEDLFRYPTDYKELDGAPIIWNETTQEWEYGNGFDPKGGHVYYGNCNTSDAISTKIVSTENGPITLKKGTVIVVKFPNGSSVSTPWLNVDQTGQHAVKVSNTYPAQNNPLIITPNAFIKFIYDGTNWVVFDDPGSWRAVTTSSASSQYKGIDFPLPVMILDGTRLAVQFNYGNSYEGAIYLTIAGHSEQVYYHGAPVSSTNKLLFSGPAIVELIRAANIWYVINEPSFASQAEVNAAVDAVIASRS